MTQRPLSALAAMILAAGCASVGADDQVHAIPFQYEKHQILLEAEVDGAGPYTFLLDTGVTPSVIDMDVAESIGLPLDLNEAGEASGAGSARASVLPTRIEALEIGGTPYGDIDAVAFSMRGLSERMGRPLHGILGESFLAGKVVTIDYWRELVTIGGASPGAGEGLLQFPLITAPDDIMPLMQVEVAGQALTVSMDTGSSFGLEIYQSALDNAGLEHLAADWEAGEAAGARGAFETRRGTLAEIGIGGITLTDIDGVTSAREGEQYRQGNAGNAMFERFIMTFDYVNGLVTMQGATGRRG